MAFFDDTISFETRRKMVDNIQFKEGVADNKLKL